MNTVEEMITQYVNAWNEETPEAQKAGFEKCLAKEVTYSDPQSGLVKGIDGISKVAEVSMEKIPGRKFIAQTKPVYYNNMATYTWQLASPSQTIDGISYFEYNDDYKLTRIVGFFPSVK